MTTASIAHTYNVYHDNENEGHKKVMTDEVLRQKLDNFLQLQQQKSLAIAIMNTHQESDALDIVQEAMMAFVVAYGNKGDNEWKPLYYRILQNKINDHHRKQKSWLRYFFRSKEDVDIGEQQPSHGPSPFSLLNTQRHGNEMIDAIRQLPDRQKQVVIYRHWQEMNVNETAHIMKISEGSVKTHLHRATNTIKKILGTNDE